MENFLVTATVTRHTHKRRTCFPSKMMLGVYAYTCGVRISVPKYSSVFSQLAFLNTHLPSKHMILSELIPSLSPEREKLVVQQNLRPFYRLKTRFYNNQS